MIVNFTNKKISPNFKIFFINKDKKNLKYHNISSNSEIKKNILKSLSKRNFKGSLGQICHIETIEKENAENIVFIGIGDEAAIHHAGRAGNVGERGCDHAAGAGFGRCQHDAQTFAGGEHLPREVFVRAHAGSPPG